MSFKVLHIDLAHGPSDSQKKKKCNIWMSVFEIFSFGVS